VITKKDDICGTCGKLGQIQLDSPIVTDGKILLKRMLKIRLTDVDWIQLT
jgi:hypothetical protein